MQTVVFRDGGAGDILAQPFKFFALPCATAHCAWKAAACASAHRLDDGSGRARQRVAEGTVGRALQLLHTASAILNRASKRSSTE